jgi:ubiquinone/menaquinone biosynthesis C-methylase UbiE
MYLTESPLYPTIVSRLQGGDSLLDVGCCFGQILRQLAVDGAPSSHLAGTDLRPEFIELGFELFQDRDTFKARFITGNVLDPKDESLEALNGQFDIIHAASFFHLFEWDDQLKAAERIIRFLKPGRASNSIILGRQVGTSTALTLEEYKAKLAAGVLERRRYVHNVASFQRLWDQAGQSTGTKWRIEGSLSEGGFDDSTTPRLVLQYVVRGLPTQ